MKGHIRERSPGKWAIILDARDPQTGKRKRRWHSFRGTKRQAQDECARLIADLKGGLTLERSKTTLAQYLVRWCEHMKSQVAPRSHERYVEIATKNITPALGNVILTKLFPSSGKESMDDATLSFVGRVFGSAGISDISTTGPPCAQRRSLALRVV